MERIVFASAAMLFLCFSMVLAQGTASKSPDLHPVVIMETSMGIMEITLDPAKAPVTVKNFLRYVQESFYDSTIFHRVIPNFMIQGGGLTINYTQKATHEPIVLESKNGLPNKRGTIAMARKNDPNSATSQFFINHVDNPSLDFSDNNPGYAVFGAVTKGIEVVNKIATVKTGAQDVPVEPVVIVSVRLK
jgi:peptidyl-prolyl cis-trans isomerase B (cyclophilin B)